MGRPVSGGRYTIQFGGVPARLTSPEGTLNGVSGTVVTVGAGGTIDLSDSMSITTGDLVLNGSGAASCAGTIAGGRTSPILRFRNSSRMTVSNNFVIRESAVVEVTAVDGAGEPDIKLGGDFINESVDPCLFNWSAGSITLNGTEPQRFEVAGRDVGAALEGFGNGSDSNFSIPTVEISPGSEVTFTNEFRNIDDVGSVAGAVPEPCTEALYAGTLILGANATATLSNTTVYYAVLEDNDGNVSVVGCGSLIQLPTCQSDAECASDSFCNSESTCAFPPQSPTGLCVSGPCSADSVCNDLTESCEDVTTLTVPRSRYLSFPIPPSSTSLEAIRVRLVSLDGFPKMENEVRWAGPPQAYPDEPDALFAASTLQCDPHFQDWGTVGILNVLGDAVVPSSVYDVQFVDSSCPSLDDESCYTGLRTITTGAWGDIVEPLAGSGSSQPDFTDIAALVDKFQALATAPSKALAQLQPSLVRPSFPIDFSDIASDIDAFTGVDYPFAGPSACP